MTRKTSTTVISLAIITFGGGLLYAGPLNPPAGPIAPTHKTLSEVEPRTPINSLNTPGDDDATPSLYKITQPGSYYLSGNVDVPAGKTGIEIAAWNVTIDLNGFRIDGGGVATFGILSTPNMLRACTIRNGEVLRFTADGINLSLWPVYTGEIDRVRSCFNGDEGITVGAGFRLSDCIAGQNGGSGFESGDGAVVTDCTAESNAGGYGYFLGVRSSVRGCLARENTNVGMYAGPGSTFDNCTVGSNHSRGIIAGAGCTLTACTVTESGGDGIVTSDGCVVSGCTSRRNDGFGITGGSRSNIFNCTASVNGLDGIHASTEAQVIGNTCVANGSIGVGAGIHVDGAGCRVDSNHVVGNDYGVRTLTGDSLIVRNTARANASGNFVFTVPTESAQVLTNPGAGFAATNPWANFAY